MTKVYLAKTGNDVRAACSTRKKALRALEFLTPWPDEEKTVEEMELDAVDQIPEGGNVYVIGLRDGGFYASLCDMDGLGQYSTIIAAKTAEAAMQKFSSISGYVAAADETT